MFLSAGQNMSRPIRSFSGRNKAGVVLRVWIVTRTGSNCRFVGTGGRSVDAAAWSLLSELELVERRAKSGTRGFSLDSLGRS